ncbi:MAG TPA: helix-turn-helix domain-containing protein [Candidatus Pacearchaeota archaeon]|nr:helix-turn-helix domain-containing protein [Candidatus Pacearchaeota archaeon]
MTKTLEQVGKFVELRAKGYSYDKIAEETGTSKPTLLKWSTEYSRELKEAEHFEMNSLLSQYGVLRQGRVQAFSSMLGSALQELKKRAEEKDYSEVPTDKLLRIALELERRLEREAEEKKFDNGALGYFKEEEVQVD